MCEPACWLEPLGVCSRCSRCSQTAPFFEHPLNKEFTCSVARPHKWATGHVQKTELATNSSPLVKFIRVYVFGNREVLWRGLQVLPQRHHIHASMTQVGHCGAHLLVSLTQAQHDAGLGHHVRLCHLGVFENTHGLGIPAHANTAPETHELHGKAS